MSNLRLIGFILVGSIENEQSFGENPSSLEMINFKRILFSAKIAENRIFELSIFYIRCRQKLTFTYPEKALQEFSVILLTRLDRLGWIVENTYLPRSCKLPWKEKS
jgi:hypothetical protein